MRHAITAVCGSRMCQFNVALNAGQRAGVRHSVLRHSCDVYLSEQDITVCRFNNVQRRCFSMSPAANCCLVLGTLHYFMRSAKSLFSVLDCLVQPDLSPYVSVCQTQSCNVFDVIAGYKCNASFRSFSACKGMLMCFRGNFC